MRTGLGQGSGKAAYLDSMHSAYMDSGYCHAREYVAANLEHAHGKCALDDGLVGAAESRKANQGAHEEQAVRSNEAELDECEGDGVAECGHDGLPGVGGEGGGGVPEGAQEDEAHR